MNDQSTTPSKPRRQHSAAPGARAFLRSAGSILTPCVLGLLFFATACGRQKPPARPNVVLITIESLRPDHLSCYGYWRRTSPFLDSLAEQGVVFSNCTAASCWTVPSLASLFTSMHPRSHGVLRGFAQEREIHGQELLDDGFVTLAETMKAAGYTTFGVSGTGHASKETGMDQGFDHFAGLWFPQSPVLHEAILGMKKELLRAKPFFLWIHYFNPHSPYIAFEPWTSRYARHPSYIAEFSGQQMELLKTQLPRIRETPAITETIIDLYDSDINYVDSYIGKLFNEIVPLDNSLVIISSDHGEAFLDHGSFGHGQSLFEEEIRIPLIIVPPAGGKLKTKTVITPVSNIDLYPTILDLLGIPRPMRLQGLSLLPLLKGMSPATERPVFAEFDRGPPLKSVRLGDWKMIVSPTNDETRMVFDLASDPGETSNLFTGRPDIAAKLTAELDRWTTTTPPFSAPLGRIHLSPEQEKTLRSLGYVR